MNPLIKKICIAAVAALITSAASAAGSVVFDNTLPSQPRGTSTTVPLVGGTYTIDSASGYITGTNLFHSFSSFSIDAGQTALFTNTLQTPIDNVISRVTGGTPSIINGTITSQIYNDSNPIPGLARTGANFWFINPAGVTIGAGATINVPAGLAIGAADSIDFADGFKFYALPSNMPTPTSLSVAAPGAFGFLPTPATGALNIQASLAPQSGFVRLASGGPLTIGGATNTPIDIFGTPMFTPVPASGGNAPYIAVAQGDITIQSMSSVSIAAGVLIDGGSFSSSPIPGTNQSFFGTAGSIAVTARGDIDSGATISTETGIQELLPGGPHFAGSLALPTISIQSTAGEVHLTGPVSNLSAGRNVGDITIDGTAVRLTGTTLNDSSSLNPHAVGGGGTSGSILITATGSSASDGSPAIDLTQSELSTSTGSSPRGLLRAGSVVLTANNGEISASTSTISSSSENNQASAGLVSLTAQNINLTNTELATVVVSTSPTDRLGQPLPAAAITLTATGPITLLNSLIDTRTIGAVEAGAITVMGQSINITGGKLPGSVNGISFPDARGNTAVTSSTGGTGDAGAITIAATGPTTISGATVSAQSASTGNGGTISVSGSGVLVAQQSLIAANYANNGGNAGAPGTIGVYATGLTAATDPLSGNLSAATPGVVRIVDSGVTAVNSGGLGAVTTDLTGTITSVQGVGTRGQIFIGESLPPPTGIATATTPVPPIVSDNVVIAGSVVANDVLAGGLGNNLTIEANRGVWIGPSPTGGYAYPNPPANFKDPRGTDLNRSLISATTEASAAAGGEVLVQGGDRGVTIDSSNIDANDSVQNDPTEPRLGYTQTQSNITITTGSANGAVTLTGSRVSADTSGINAAGNIDISGASVAVSGGEVSAATTGAASAGNIGMSASGATGTNGAASLQVSDGAQIYADALNGQDSAHAGRVVLQASQGTVSISGTLGDPILGTALTTSAGDKAGAAGAISITGQRVTLSGTAIATTVASLEKPPRTQPGTITLTATTGAVTVTNSRLSADTTGAIDAGNISISGNGVTIDPFNISANTSGSGNAGTITISDTSGSVQPGGTEVRPPRPFKHAMRELRRRSREEGERSSSKRLSSDTRSEHHGEHHD
jgi:filamentous hemagglutinin family protein